MSDTSIRPTICGRLNAFRRPGQALWIRCGEMEKDLVLTLMFRDYCSLCHKMRDALLPYQQQYGFALAVVDVEGSLHAFQIEGNQRLKKLVTHKLFDKGTEVHSFFLLFLKWEVSRPLVLSPRTRQSSSELPMEESSRSMRRMRRKRPSARYSL